MFKLSFIDRRLIRHFDWALFAFALLVPLCGLLVLYSAGFDPDSTGANPYLPFPVKSQPFLKQSIFLCSGLVAMGFALALSPQFLYRSAYFAYAGGVILLIAVLAVGIVVNGSRRWIPLGGGFNLQPSEIMKIGLILAMAKYLTRNPPKGKPYGLWQVIPPTIIFLIPMALIEKQPDLGSAISVGGIGALMILFMGVRPRLIFSVLLLAAVAAPFVWHKLHGYQQRRILTLINPEADPRGSGYHITQSIIAVGSGQLTGKGYMRGTQTQLEFLPEHTTDFVFSVLAEEWGFAGCIFVIGLYMALIYRLLRVTAKTKDLFLSLVAFGMASAFGVNSIINISMVIGIMPVVGIPLPMFSYGGSAMLAMMFGLGLVLGISMRRLSFTQGA